MKGREERHKSIRRKQNIKERLYERENERKKETECWQTQRGEDVDESLF